MNIIVNNSSMTPIYEQISDQIKTAILKGHALPQEALPSVRTLAKDLKISALTVKKAYDLLESEGFIITVHGKGSFIAETNDNLLLETKRKEVEQELEAAAEKGKRCGMSNQDLIDLMTMILEE